MTDRRDSPSAQEISFFRDASHVNMPGANIVGTQNYNNTYVYNSGNPLHLLYSKVAHNAILNAGGRADEVKCHPGTREEILSILKRWRDDGPDRMFWLSGPAGAGKSAIIQTFAEKYITSALIMINFFFFRSDSTRNHIAPLVATLMFQLLDFYPDAKRLISSVIAEMPYIFEKSLRDQFLHLIINPINALREAHSDTHPILILIDGLDECGTEPNEAQQVQARLVQILNDLVSTPASPFMVLVSSRPEAHLTRAFYAIEGQYSSIFLDSKYRPSDDIRTYLTDEFAKIKTTHNLRHTIDAQWPSPDDINKIVTKSSGQFIYAATVVRFLSLSSANPVYSLDQIKGIRPAKQNLPFAALDAVYIHILSQADDLDAVKVILSARVFWNFDVLKRIILSKSSTFTTIIKPLGYTESDVISHIANLGALMTYKSDYIQFYHASFIDFLIDPTRSRHLFLDIPVFTADLLVAHLPHMFTDYRHLHETLSIASRVSVSNAALEDALAAFSPHDHKFPKDLVPAFTCLLRMLNHLYSENNEHFYEAILRKWLLFSHKNNIPADKLELDQIKLGLEIWAEITPMSLRASGRAKTTKQNKGPARD